MKPRFHMLSVAGLLCVVAFSVGLQAEPEAQKKNTPDYSFSGKPHAKDLISKVVAVLYYDDVFKCENLSLKIEGRHLDLFTTWSNNIAPKDLRFESDQKYRVTLIHDNRVHPTMLWGKYGTAVPSVSRIEALDGEVIYDASICPKHRKRARRLRLPITKPFSDPTPVAIRLRKFPYGCVSHPTLKASWAPDTRETVLEFVCDECVKTRKAFQKNNSEQLGTGQPNTASKSTPEDNSKP